MARGVHHITMVGSNRTATWKCLYDRPAAITDTTSLVLVSLFLDPAKPSYIGCWLAMAREGMREMADLTIHLQAVSTNEQEHPSLADQMWADIAYTLRAAGAHDEA